MRAMKVKLFIPLLVVYALASAGCAGNDVPTIVTNVADNGSLLLKDVRLFGESIMDADAKGLIKRENSRRVIESLDKSNKAAVVVADKLTALVHLSDVAQRKPLLDEIQNGLDIISLGVVNALIPIDDPVTREKVGVFAASLSKTVGIINRQLLTGAK